MCTRGDDVIFGSQKKRRKFCAKRKKHILDNSNHEVVSVHICADSTHSTVDPQNTASHGGLLGGLATPIEEEEESLDEMSLPVPVDLEDRNAYEGIGGLLQGAGRKLRIPKFRPSSLVGGGLSPSSQRKGGSDGQTLISTSIAEHRCVMSCA